MRGAICYYSATGNTRLACGYVARRLGAHECELIDVIERPDADLSAYDFIGFAAPTDFGGLPRLFDRFLAEQPVRTGTPAFVLNTYGFQSGRTIRDLAEQVGARGYRVLAAHSARTPENYPPMIAIGLGFPNRPNASDLTKLDAFAASARWALDVAESTGELPEPRLSFGLLSAIAPHQPRDRAHADMGEKRVDDALCTRCGTCAKRCPYHAITLEPTPVFDESACAGCWRCYNACPARAIATGRFTGTPFYARPSDHARDVLGE